MQTKIREIKHPAIFTTKVDTGRLHSKLSQPKHPQSILNTAPVPPPINTAQNVLHLIPLLPEVFAKYHTRDLLHTLNNSAFLPDLPNLLKALCSRWTL